MKRKRKNGIKPDKVAIIGGMIILAASLWFIYEIVSVVLESGWAR